MKKRLLASLLALVMTLSLMPISAFAGESTDEEASSSHLVKTATVNSDGSYQIDLKAWVDGREESTPLDVVLVLDQSGSISDSGSLQSLKNAVTGIANSLKEDGEKHNIDHRIALVGFANDDTNDDKYKNTGLYINGELVNYGYTHYEKVYDDGSLDKNKTYYYYAYKSDPNNGWWESVYWSSNYNSWIAKTGLYAEKINLRTGPNDTDSSHYQVYDKQIGFTALDYQNALVNVKSGDSVAASVTTAIGNLQAEGSSCISLGMEMAYKIFQNNDSTGRDRIVIVVTDGDITYTGAYGKYHFAEGEANAALGYANNIKSLTDSKIFVVRTPASSSSYEKYKTEVDNFVKSLPSGSGYLMSVSDYSGLGAAFEHILSSLSSATVTTVLTDTVSEYFDFQGLTIVDDAVTAGVTVKKVPYAGKVDGKDTWDEANAVDITDKVTISVSGKTVTVTGFDYAANAVGMLDDTPKGYQLVLSFAVRPDPYCNDWTADTEYPTNEGDATLANDGTTFATAASPEVEVQTCKVEYQWADSNVPAGQTLPATTYYITGQTHFVDTTDRTVTGWTFGGWKIDGKDAGTAIEIGNENVTITGAWTRNSYAVTYTDGVETEEVFTDQTTTAEFGKAIPAFDNGSESDTPSRTGWTFTGWTWYQVNDDGSTTELDAKPDTMPAYDLKAVANWEENHVPAADLHVTKRPYRVNLEAADPANASAEVGDLVEWLIVVENRGDAEGCFTLVDMLDGATELEVYPALAEGKTYYTIPAGGTMEFTVAYRVKEADAGATLYNSVSIYAGDDAEQEDPLNTGDSYGVKVYEINAPDEKNGIQLGDFISKKYTARYDALDDRDTFHATAKVWPLDDVDLLDADSADQVIEPDSDPCATVTGGVTLATGNSQAFTFEELTLPVGAYMVVVSEDDDGAAYVTYDENVYRFLLLVSGAPESGSSGEGVEVISLDATDDNETDDKKPREYAAYGLERYDAEENAWVTVQDDSETPDIVFRNVYAPTEEDGIQLGDFISKAYTSRYGTENSNTFYASADIWMLNSVELLDADSNDEDEQNSDPYMTVAGSVTLTTGNTKRFSFDPVSLPVGAYMIEVREDDDGASYVTYDENVYRFLLLVSGEDEYAAYGLECYDAEEDEWLTVTADDTLSSVTFCNEYTYRRPRPVPTVTVKPAEPKLNTADHDAYLMGYPDGTVRPNGQITRAEAATIFFRLLTDESREQFWATGNSYSDVFPTDWYNNAISTLSNAGIVSGYPDGTFRPNEPITRAEMSKMIALFADLDRSLDLFDDIAGHWAESYIRLAAGNGWIAGYPDGTFRPDQSITRAETVTMINRVLERVPADEDQIFSHSKMLTFPDCESGDWYYIAIQEATNSHTYERAEDETDGDEEWIKLIDNRDWTELEN